MAILTIANHKGGTGKTTSALHVSAALGLSGKRVLAIDLDPQGFLTRSLGVPEPSTKASSLALFKPGASLQEITPLKMNGFDLIPSSGALTNALRRLNKPTDVFWLKEALDKGYDYDMVILDTAAAVTVFSLNALVACKHVLVPVTPEQQPVLGAQQTFQTCKLVRDRLNPSLKDPLFLFTQVDGRMRTHTNYQKYVRETFGDLVLKSVIRTSSSLAEVSADGKTVFDRNLVSRGARDYANATDEIMNRSFPELSALGFQNKVKGAPVIPAQAR